MGREGGSDKNNRFPRFGSGLVSAEAGALWLRNRRNSCCLGGKAWFLLLFLFLLLLQCLGVVGVEPSRLRDIIHRLKRFLTFEKAGKNNISFRRVSVVILLRLVPCCQFIESALKKTGVPCPMSKSLYLQFPRNAAKSTLPHPRSHFTVIAPHYRRILDTEKFRPHATAVPILRIFELSPIKRRFRSLLHRRRAVLFLKNVPVIAPPHARQDGIPQNRKKKTVRPCEMRVCVRLRAHLECNVRVCVRAM